MDLCCDHRVQTWGWEEEILKESEEREQDVWTDGAAWTREIIMGSGKGATTRKSRAVEGGWYDPRGLQGALNKGDPGRGWAPRESPTALSMNPCLP